MSSGYYSYGGGSSGGSGRGGSGHGGSGGYYFGHSDPSKSKSSGDEWTCMSFQCSLYGGTKTRGAKCHVCGQARPAGGCNPAPPGPSGGSSSGDKKKSSSSKKTSSSSKKRH